MASFWKDLVTGGAASEEEAAERAADEARQAAARAETYIKTGFTEALSEFSPFKDVGLEALQQLKTFALSPEQSATGQYATKQLEKSLKARGLYQSGAGIREEVGLTAAEEAQKNQILQNLMDIGYQASSATGELSRQRGLTLGQHETNLGDIMANSVLAQGAAKAGGIQNIQSLIKGAIGLGTMGINPIGVTGSIPGMSSSLGQPQTWIKE